MDRAVFLDRDGVLNELKYNERELLWDSPYTLDDFHWLPGVPEAIRQLNQLGLKTIVVSNQPGVAKGKCAIGFLETLTQQITTDLKKIGAWLDGIYYCLHHPEGSVLEYRMDCDCRKPKSGLLLKASQQHNIDLSSSYMIGDRFIDIQAGQAAGCKSIFVESPATNRYNLSEYIDSFPNLPQAVRRIWQDERVP